MVQQPPMAVLGEYLNRLLPQVLTPEQHGLIIQTSERNVGDLVKVVQTLSSMRAAGRELTMDNVKRERWVPSSMFFACLFHVPSSISSRFIQS